MATSTTASDLSASTGILPVKGFEFHEVMGGDCTFTAGPVAGRSVRVEFDMRAYAPSLPKFLSKRSGAGVFRTAKLDGVMRIEGFAKDVPATGGLQMNLLKSRGMMVYDIDFAASDGKQYHLHGEKHRDLLNMQRGMTTLYTDIVEKASGQKVASGILYFDIKGLVPFLKTWKLV